MIQAPTKIAKKAFPISLVLLGLSNLFFPAFGQQKSLNVVILYSDDQRYNTIHALGNEAISTPNLDRLVKRGVAFTRAQRHPSPEVTPGVLRFISTVCTSRKMEVRNIRDTSTSTHRGSKKKPINGLTPNQTLSL